jgi:predicted  nucleic acid-binding Zn-ribbon protein
MKSQTGKVEEDALEQLNQVDMFEQEMMKLQQQIIDRRKLVEVAAAEVAACREEIGQQLHDLTVERDTAQGELPDDTQVIFNRLCDHEDGEALAEVIEEDRRRMTYTCGGCYMNVPFEHVNTLLSRPDELACCTSCGRILYMNQELKISMAVK